MSAAAIVTDISLSDSLGTHLSVQLAICRPPGYLFLFEYWYAMFSETAEKKTLLFRLGLSMMQTRTTSSPDWTPIAALAPFKKAGLES